MKHMIRLGALGVAASLLVGCGPSPGKVCAKLKELDSLPFGGETGCQIKWDKYKQESPDKYKAEAECILKASAKADLAECSP